MKICFWVSHVATVGGVQRVTALLASKLSTVYDVTVVTNDTKEDLERNIYDLSDKVNVLIQPDSLNKALRIPMIYK